MSKLILFHKLIILTIIESTCTIVINQNLNITFSKICRLQSLNTTITNQLKCILTCKNVQCNHLSYLNSTCTLYNINPELVSYTLINQLKFNYVLSENIKKMNLLI